MRYASLTAPYGVSYRHVCIPGSTVLLTWVTHRRAPLFQHPYDISRLRQAGSQTKGEAPFTIDAAAILPDHVNVMGGNGAFGSIPFGWRKEALADYLDDVHHNPVKHGLVSCPHMWPYSRLRKWIAEGHYRPDWACRCEGREIDVGEFLQADKYAGE